MSPILVVGAGPVGLTMAAELARFGLPVRLIDRSAHATETSKALVVWSRTLELMDRMGCSKAFVDAGLKAHGASIRSGGQDLAHISFDSIASVYNYALMLPQRDTERLLGAHLESFGGHVERQVELVEFREVGSHVEARLRHADGTEETLETPYLIGSDGAHSTVRHGLGLAFKGAAQGDDWLLADVRLEGPDAPPADAISTFLHPDGPFVAFPIPGSRARIVAAIGKADPARKRPDPSLADVQAMIDRRAGGFQATDPVWLTTFRINERKVDQYGRGLVFLAGDAAHVHSPAGGQGMNTGMQDAINLAWKLAMVENGQATRSLLDSYSPERSAVGDMVLRNASRLTDMGTLSNPAAQKARNLAVHFMLGFHAIQDRMATNMSEIEIAYAKSLLSAGRHGGARLIPAHYDGAPPGSASRPRFVLFSTDKARAAALVAQYAGVLESEARTPPADSILIVRPDGYIGLDAKPDAWEEADAYLKRVASPAAS